ncbi:MAG: metallophosphoesterase family protein, partial [Christensenellales bacterium]
MMKRKKEQTKQKRKVRGWRVVGIVFACIISVVLICSLVGAIGNGANVKLIKGLEKVVADDPLQAPVIDEETGYYTFTCDRDFRVLQLTDVHIGGGFLSIGKDNKAINAVYDLVSYVKPDLVVITGDLVYPVPFQSGSFNNLTPTKIIAQLMEQMGIYWAFAYGNHDTEVYSFYDRKEISEFYENSDYKYCLFQRGPDDVDGYGNYVINVKNSAGIITQSLFMLDSHAYSKGFWRDYDNLHQNQVDWYEREVKR